MEKTKKIYLVEFYHHDWDNEEETRVPLRAFVDRDIAVMFAGLCEIEKERIQMTLQAYWMEHQPERDRISKSQRAVLLSKTYVIGNPDELRAQEIWTGAKKIETSHKYHPDWSVFQDSDIDYEVNTVELVL